MERELRLGGCVLEPCTVLNLFVFNPTMKVQCHETAVRWRKVQFSYIYIFWACLCIKVVTERKLVEIRKEFKRTRRKIQYLTCLTHQFQGFDLAPTQG